MNESRNKRSAGVGVFILIGLLFLAGGILTIGNLHSTFQNKTTINTIFKDVNGLQSGNNIWFSGVKIGTVKKTEFYGKSDVKVLMNINSESKMYIRKDAKVKISTDGLIGNKILIIYGGSSSHPEIEEGDNLSNETSLSTDTIMNTLQQNNLNVLAITKKLSAGEGTIGRLLNNDSLYTSLSASLTDLQRTAENAKQAAISIAKFSANLNKTGSLLNGLTTDTLAFNTVKSSILKINRIADTVVFLANGLKDIHTNPESPLFIMFHDAQTGAQLKSIMSNLKSSSENLNKDLLGLQHTFLLKRYFKNAQKKDSLAN